MMGDSYPKKYMVLIFTLSNYVFFRRKEHNSMESAEVATRHNPIIERLNNLLELHLVCETLSKS